VYVYFFIQPLPQEYLFMKTYGKAAESSPKTSTNTKVTICHASIKSFPTKRLSEVERHMKQFQKMSLQCWVILNGILP